MSYFTETIQSTIDHRVIASLHSNPLFVSFFSSSFVRNNNTNHAQYLQHVFDNKLAVQFVRTAQEAVRAAKYGTRGSVVCGDVPVAFDIASRNACRFNLVRFGGGGGRGGGGRPACIARSCASTSAGSAWPGSGCTVRGPWYSTICASSVVVNAVLRHSCANGEENAVPDSLQAAEWGGAED